MFERGIDARRVASVPAAQMEAAFRTALAKASTKPTLRYLSDPADYVRPGIVTWTLPTS